MLLRRHLGLRSVILALAACVAAAPVRAAELDKFLPADTEIYIHINIKQALSSEFAKNAGIDQVGGLLKQVVNIEDILKDLEFDPLKDLHSITISSPNITGNETDRGLVIIHGKFKVEKFNAKGADLVKNMGETVKAHKIAGVTLYEVAIPFQDQALFVALPDESTILVAPGKDYIVDAIKREKGKEAVVLKNKDFGAVLQGMDPKQTVSMAAVGEALTKLTDEGTIKDILKKVEALGGGITLDKDIKLQVVIGAKAAMDATDLRKTVNDYLLKGQTDHRPPGHAGAEAGPGHGRAQDDPLHVEGKDCHHQGGAERRGVAVHSEGASGPVAGLSMKDEG